MINQIYKMTITVSINNVNHDIIHSHISQKLIKFLDFIIFEKNVNCTAIRHDLSPFKLGNVTVALISFSH